MRGVGKRFPGVRALADVSLTLDAGEVLVLVGENGAGKSTLMKILAGALQADEGEIFIDGERVKIGSPQEARRLGIGMIYQEFTLVPQLTVPANVSLGIEPTRAGFIDAAAVRARSDAALAELGLELPRDVPVSSLSVGQQQSVEIAKALATRARIIVMDEPTAALSDREIERLFAIMRRLRENGAGIIYISHRMEELPRIADRVTVMRDGRIVDTRPVRGVPARRDRRGDGGSPARTAVPRPARPGARRGAAPAGRRADAGRHLRRRQLRGARRERSSVSRA